MQNTKLLFIFESLRTVEDVITGEVKLALKKLILNVLTMVVQQDLDNRLQILFFSAQRGIQSDGESLAEYVLLDVIR